MAVHISSFADGLKGFGKFYNFLNRYFWNVFGPANMNYQLQFVVDVLVGQPDNLCTIVFTFPYQAT